MCMEVGWAVTTKREIKQNSLDLTSFALIPKYLFRPQQSSQVAFAFTHCLYFPTFLFTF